MIAIRAAWYIIANCRWSSQVQHTLCMVTRSDSVCRNGHLGLACIGSSFVRNSCRPCGRASTNRGTKLSSDLHDLISGSRIKSVDLLGCHRQHLLDQGLLIRLRGWSHRCRRMVRWLLDWRSSDLCWCAVRWIRRLWRVLLCGRLRWILGSLCSWGNNAGKDVGVDKAE